MGELVERTISMSAKFTQPLFDITGAEYFKRSRQSRDRALIEKPDLLGIPSLCTLSVRQSGHYYEIEAVPSSRLERCPKCLALGHQLHRHDTRRKRIKDIPMRGNRALIHLYSHRYKCQKCEHVIQQLLDGLDLRRGMTKRLLEYIERESLRTDKNFMMVADEVGVNEKTVRNIFTKLIKRLSRSWRFEAPKVLGIDEVYIAGVARCVLTDPENRKFINLLHKRDMLTVRRHLLQIKHPDRIKVVVMDMYRPYYDEVLKRFPNVVIVIDVYHILRMATAAVMSVRQQLRNNNKRLSLPKVYLLRKRKHALPLKKRLELENRLAEIPQLAEVHELKEQFFNVWNFINREEAEKGYDEWVKKIPLHLQFAFKDLLTAMANWRREIFNFFDYQVTNAFTESLNSIIKNMQRAGRGYTFDVTRAKLLYGSPFVTRRPLYSTGAKKSSCPVNTKAPKRKRAKRADDVPNPQANVRQLRQIRRSEDEFTELLRPPDGYLERFKHLDHIKQLGLF